MTNATHDFKRVLVTGGAGFIGVEMVRQLHARGKEVVVFDLWPQLERARKFLPPGVETFHGSVLDRTALRDAIDGCDAVIHLAAVLGVAKTERFKLHTIEVNVNGTQNVVEIAATHGVKKLTFASSSEVYGEPSESPVKETTPTQGKTVYAVTKMMGEEVCKAFNQRYPHFRYTIVRYFNTYGPLQVAEFVLTRFIRAAMVGEAPLINGDGTQLRSYCYCEDSCRGTIDATFAQAADGQVLNLGNSTQRFTLEEAARIVLRVTGREGQLEPVFDRQFARGDRLQTREIFTRICDTSKAAAMIGYEARISLEDGVRRIVALGEPPETWTPLRSVVEHSD
jgi:UDP-glucose 4-epimerase